MTTLLTAGRRWLCMLTLTSVWVAALYGQDDPAAEADAEEARQVQIAARFVSILEKSPRRGTALDRVYGHHVEFGTLDRFVGELKARVETDPADGPGWMILGLVESLRGEDANAVAALTQAEQARSDDPLASYYLGQSLLLVGQPDQAVAAFERALERKPERADLLEIFQQLGRVHQRAQRDEEAREVWTRLEQLFPDDPRVLEQIAVTLMEEGQFGEALTRFERLITLVQDDYRKTTFRMQAAELKIREKRRDEGLTDLENLLSDLNPESWLYRDVRRRIEDVFVRSGDQDGLVKYYEKWLTDHPQDLDAMARVATFLASGARVPEAMQWLDKALKLAPTRIDLRRSFIRQLLDDQRYSEAVQQYALLSAAAPGNVDILRDWGRTVLKDTSLAEDARKQEATRIWNLIVATQPDDALTVSQAADLFRQAKLNDEAADLYEKAITLAPEDPQYREYLGEFRQLLGEKDAALAVWREIAAGSRRTAQNLARLAEVLNRFSYAEEAADTVAEAAKLDAKDLSLQLQAAEYQTKAGRHDAALAYIAASEALTENDEEAAVVLRQKIEVLQGAEKLDAEIAVLSARLQAAPEAPARDWHTLARYHEADRAWTDAEHAIQQALAKEPQSIAMLTTAARIAELAGDFGRAADLFRDLAGIDRRSRGDHLTNVARIEAQLGRTDEALQAGRDLIVSAPGNTEHYEFYAQLCFRLGKSEDGINALRKAVRINPAEPQLITTLAGALANEFRTDEAIQLYWQAFEKSEDLGDQTSLIMKLTELHLQLNQFDGLIERLERSRREEQQRRAMTICLAQAQHTAGDYGTARAELESLLTSDTRDTELLLQLSKLCEQGQDFDAAVEYQQQIVAIAPGPETEYRLAQLLQNQGEYEQATDILSQLLLREEDPVRMLRGVDSLLNQQTFESALAVIEPLRRERRDDWELLYREGAAWAALEREDEAADRFRQILALPVSIDALGLREEARFTQAESKAKSDERRGITAEFPVRPTALSAISAINEVRNAVGLEYRNYYGGQTPQTWTPGTYGQARLAAWAWLFKFAQNAGNAGEFAQELQVAAADEAATRETLIDWLYVQRMQNRYSASFDALRRLARNGGADEQKFYLEALPQRGITDDNMRRSGNQQQKQPPLPNEELDFAVTCLESLLARSNLKTDRSMYQLTNSVTAVVKELKLAEREDQAKQVLDDFVGRADTLQAIGSMFALCSDMEWDDAAEKLRVRWKEAAKRELAQKTAQSSPRSQRATVTAYAGNMLTRMMGKLGAAEEHDAVLAMLDDATELSIEEARIRRTQRKPRGGPPQQQGSQHYTIWHGKQGQGMQVDFPRPNEHIDAGTINVLRQAYETFKRNDVESDLADHLDRQLQAAKDDERLYRLLHKAAVLWWQEEQDEALTLYAEAAGLAPQDVVLKLELTSLHEARGEFDEALAIVEGIVAVDQRMLQTRETMAMQLAERLGDLERARTAAERLFGLRLDTQTQMALASHMRRLGMHDLAAAVVSRADRRAGNQSSSLLLLMTQYQGQGNTALAQQIAFRILQRTQGAVGQGQRGNPMRRNQTQDSQSRQQAMRVLSQTGALQPLIDQVEERLAKSPDSPRLYEQLIEFYTALGNRDKVQELLTRAVEQRPNVSSLNFQLAKYMEQNGKHKEACDVYLKLLKSHPDWFRNDFYEVRNVFQRAQREKELAELVSAMDLRPFGHPHYVMDIAQNLLRQEETKELAISLYEKCFDQFPSYRSQVISNLYDPQVWKIPRVYELGLKCLLPDEGTAAGQPWYGLTEAVSYSQGGTVSGAFHRMFDGVRGSPRETELRQAIAQRVEQVPAWHGGRAMLALCDIRAGKKDDGVAALEALAADEAVFEGMPYNARWIIGQEFDQQERTRELAIRLFVAAAADSQNSGNQIEHSPVVRLIRLYADMGEKERAKELLLKSINVQPNYYDDQYRNYLRTNNGVFAASEFTRLEMPADAIRIYREMLLQQDILRTAGSWNGYGDNHYVNMARQGLDKALASLNAANAEPAIAELLAPPAKRSQNEAVLDLMLMVPTVEQLGQQSLESPLLKLLESVATNPTIESAISSRLQALATEYPGDIAVAVALAMWDVQRANAADVGHLDRLARLLDEQPLEELTEGRRPNSRQRASAAARIPLWLVARECLKQDALRATGLKLADAAIAGADRQLDEQALSAILFEWGTTAANAGDLEEAERRWSQLLDAVTERPQLKKKPVDQPTGARAGRLRDRALSRLSEPPGSARRSMRVEAAGAAASVSAAAGSARSPEQAAKIDELRARMAERREASRARSLERRAARRTAAAEVGATGSANASQSDPESPLALAKPVAPGGIAAVEPPRAPRASQFVTAPLTPTLSPDSRHLTGEAARGGEGNTAGLNPAARAGDADGESSPAATAETTPAAEFIAPLTVPQFRVTIAIAREAAKRKLPELSRRAVREALRGGPPVPVAQAGQSGGRSIGRLSGTTVVYGGGIVSSSMGLQQADSGEGSAVEVAEALQTVLALWDPETYSPNDVYDVLAPLVLPPNRPGEILLYPDSGRIDQLQVSSLAATFVVWAQRAQRIDEMRTALATRRENAISKISALVLETQIALLDNDNAAAEAALHEIDATLTMGLTPDTVMLSAHAAIPALERPELTIPAVALLHRVVEQQIQQIATNNREPKFTPLTRRINAALRAQGKVDAIKKFYQSYLNCNQSYYVRYSGEYGLWRQMQVVAQIAADAAQNVGPDLALEYLGQVGDVTFTEQQPVSTKVALAAAASQTSSQSAEERYALWRDWTLPTEGRRTLRMTADLIDRVALPAEFYPLRSQTEGHDLEFLKRHELLSNFGLLIDAAREANAVADLKPRVQAAVDEKLPNAEFLWALVLIAAEDPDAPAAVAALGASARERHRPPEGRYRQPNMWGDFLVCTAALADSQTSDAAQPLADFLLSGELGGLTAARTRLVRDMAAAARRAAGAAGPPPESALAHWATGTVWDLYNNPYSDRYNNNNVVAASPAAAWWCVSEGRLARLAGSGNDMLLFPYPITGNFEFVFERLSTTASSANVGYGGVIPVSNYDNLFIQSAGGHERFERRKMGLEQRAAGYERFKLASDGTQVRFSLADHVVYEEPLTRTSPWLHLYATDARTSVLRNLRLTGQPVIPREVPLFDGDRMEGWNAQTFGETQRPHRTLAEKAPDDVNDWRYRQRMQLPTTFTWNVADGVLTGEKRAGSRIRAAAASAGALSGPRLSGQQSWLYYFRPLAAGERVQYEFFYAPGSEVHPSLGRLAFVLAPDGVHTHWITTESDRDLCQLADTNLLLEADCQRHGGTVPLRANDWNTVGLRLSDAAVTIELNGVPVFERPVAAGDDRRLGLFRDATVETKVRNAVLSGDWPETLPEDLLATVADSPAIDQRIHADLITRTAAGATADFARDIVLQARQQPDEAAFNTVRNWVLPNDLHGDVRLFSKHGPIAPLAPLDGSETPTHPGEVLMPAWELMRLAQKLNRLDEIAAAVEAIPGDDPKVGFSRTALRVMVLAAQGHEQAAREQLLAARDTFLGPPGDAKDEEGPQNNQTPRGIRDGHAMLAALWGAVEHPGLVADARECLTVIRSHLVAKKQAREPRFTDLNDDWTNVAAARIAAHELADTQGPESLAQWSHIAVDTAPSRGLGMLPTSFRRAAGRIEHFPGQEFSQLMFQSPLVGQFEIVARGTFGRPNPLLVAYGMQAVAAVGDPYETLSAQLMRKFEKAAGFPIPDLPEVSELRIAVDGSQVKYSLNGTLVRELVLSPQPDPWIAIQSFDPGGRAALHSLRIEGTPTVPDEIRLLETAHIAGLRTEYFDSVSVDPANERAAWQCLGEELTGRHFYYVDTLSLQSALVYQRPMLEDGEFEFETYYLPGQLEVHPCIGRTVLVLKPEGPQLHMRTDGPFERSGRLPENVAALEGAQPAPLKEKDWNHVKVAVSGDRATLFVNGIECAQVDLQDPRSGRKLGLFRWSNQTKCRVRNFVYRGQWPKSVPVVTAQELAGDASVAAN